MLFRRVTSFLCYFAATVSVACGNHSCVANVYIEILQLVVVSIGHVLSIKVESFHL